MTHKERLETYQRDLRIVEQNLQALNQEVQQNQVTRLQLQGAISAMGAVLQDEAETAPSKLTVVTGGEAGE